MDSIYFELFTDTFLAGFIFPFQAELILPVTLSFGEYSTFIIFIIALLGGVLGLLANYCIGRILVWNSTIAKFAIWLLVFGFLIVLAAFFAVSYRDIIENYAFSSFHIVIGVVILIVLSTGIYKFIVKDQDIAELQARYTALRSFFQKYLVWLLLISGISFTSGLIASGPMVAGMLDGLGVYINAFFGGLLPLVSGLLKIDFIRVLGLLAASKGIFLMVVIFV